MAVTLNQIASKIEKIEGKKSQARIGDIREILKILIDLEINQFSGGPLFDLLCMANHRRTKKVLRNRANKK